MDSTCKCTNIQSVQGLRREPLDRFTAAFARRLSHVQAALERRCELASRQGAVSSRIMLQQSWRFAGWAPICLLMEEALEGFEQVQALGVAHYPERAAAYEAPQVARRGRQDRGPSAVAIVPQLDVSEPHRADGAGRIELQHPRLVSVSSPDEAVSCLFTSDQGTSLDICVFDPNYFCA